MSWHRLTHTPMLSTSSDRPQIFQWLMRAYIWISEIVHTLYKATDAKNWMYNNSNHSTQSFQPHSTTSYYGWLPNFLLVSKINFQTSQVDRGSISEFTRLLSRASFIFLFHRQLICGSKVGLEGRSCYFSWYLGVCFMGFLFNQGSAFLFCCCDRILIQELLLWA